MKRLPNPYPWVLTLFLEDKRGKKPKASMGKFAFATEAQAHARIPELSKQHDVVFIELSHRTAIFDCQNK